ncbi:MAG TPA: DUF4197 domain-containing protein [Chitinophagales bacterium]|nr:DUF4197 domain-containing protein [Chitinophagales bacterium]
MFKTFSSFLLIAGFICSSCAQMSQSQGTKTGSSSTTTTSTQTTKGTKSGSTGSTSQQSPSSPSSKQGGSSTTAPSTKGTKSGSPGSSSQQSPSSSSSNQSGIGGLSNDQIVSGLKEALSLGAQKSSDKLSITDGFFKNLAVKILMPPEAKDVESKLRSIGMGAQVDNAILSMNRAAEKASKDAAPIFINAVKQMSFSDAAKILTGPNDAATQYLKKTTSAQLTTKFKPVIQSALAATNATKYWNDVFTNYNKIPFVSKVNPDLTSYVTQKALDGLFFTLAQEEAKIRKDPMGTANNIIQTVFGALLNH